MKRDRIILCADREPLHSMGAVRRSTHRMVVWHPPTRPMTSRLQLRYKQQCAAGTRGRHSQGNTPQRGRCRRCIEGCERVANLLSQQRDQQPNPRGSRARHHRGANRSAKSTESRRRASLRCDGSKQSLTSATKRSTRTCGKRLKFKAGGKKLARRRMRCKSRGRPSRAPVGRVDRVRECWAVL